jgi:hypothetical protein
VSGDITADLDPRLDVDQSLRRVRFHVGEPEAVLHRWRAVLRAAWPRGWDAVRPLAGGVMDLVGDSRVLFVSALDLRADGPKAPGPNGLPLHALDGDELWRMCTALAAAVRAGTYRPGKERVVWVPKTSGNGRRPIVVMDAQDQVIQKAASLVLRPMLDPLFDPLSFAYRPGRSRDQAVAVACQLARDGYPVWLAHDLENAYGRVPVPRLLDVFHHLLPCDRLRAFLGMVLPPQSRSLGGSSRADRSARPRSRSTLTTSSTDRGGGPAWTSAWSGTPTTSCSRHGPRKTRPGRTTNSAGC